PGEFQDRGELARQERGLQAHCYPAKENVFAYRGLVVEPQAHVEQRLTGSRHLQVAASGLVDTIEYPQEGRLASPVPAEDGQAVALANLEADIVQQARHPPLRRIERRTEEQVLPARPAALTLQVNRNVQRQAIRTNTGAHTSDPEWDATRIAAIHQSTGNQAGGGEHRDIQERGPVEHSLQDRGAEDLDEMEQGIEAHQGPAQAAF